jgi:hypothetical protein
MSRCSITLLRVLLEYDQAENIVLTGVTTTVGACQYYHFVDDCYKVPSDQIHQCIWRKKCDNLPIMTSSARTFQVKAIEVGFGWYVE